MSRVPIDAIELPDDPGPLWVFGYGSLMWNPGFDHDACGAARVFGLHRRLCLSSIYYRGTREDPGLVLGLDLGGSCHGRAFRVPASRKREAALYLYEREMRNGTYTPVYAATRVENHGLVRALAFRVRRDHAQYTPPLDPEVAAERVRRCRGDRGDNLEYVVNTWRALRDMGVYDRGLERVVSRVLGNPAQPMVQERVGKERSACRIP